MSTGTSKTTGPVPTKALRARINAAYAEQSRALFEEKLIVDHLPMVRHIVQKVTAHLPWKPELEDLISAGTLGLVRAARHFDCSRQVAFSTYAYIRIRGAVIDELRQRSFVSSEAHGRIRTIRTAYEEHLAAGGRPPTDEELIQALSAAIQELPEKERLTILLYYERDLTMKEAGEVLKVSESRVSQLHASALFKLSMELRNLQ